jgi:hypothetical protein
MPSHVAVMPAPKSTICELWPEFGRNEGAEKGRGAPATRLEGPRPRHNECHSVASGADHEALSAPENALFMQRCSLPPK